MSHGVRSRHSSGVFLLVAAGLTIAAPVSVLADAGAKPESWCSLMLGSAIDQGGATPPDAEILQLDLHAARYEVDIVGNLAVGSLRLEFFNGTTVPLRSKYVGLTPTGTQVEAILASIDASETDEWVELFAQQAKAEPKGRGPVRQKAKPATASANLEIDVPMGGTVTVLKKFRSAIAFDEDRFGLVLPAVGGDCTSAVEGWPEGFVGLTPLDVLVNIHHFEPLALAESPTHDVLVSFMDTHSVVEVVSGPLGDQSFELGFALGRLDQPALTAYASPESDGIREVMMVLAPAIEAPEESIRPKEALFVLDTSGSMDGDKILEAVKALTSCLEHVAPSDRFNIVEFDQDFSVAFPEPVDGEPSNVNKAMQWLGGQRSGGGTSLFPALSETFEQPHDDTMHRLVVVLTDGKLGDAREVERFLEERLGEARLFVVGIGEDANEREIVKLAELGRGTAVFARDAEQLASAVTGLFAGIASPVAWDLKVHWGGAEVISMDPSRVPDLYAGRPVTIRARVRGELPQELLVEASTMDGVRVFQTALPSGGAREYDQIGRQGR